jgi:hypothetical protein
MARMHVCSCIGCPAHEGSCPELSPQRRCPACSTTAEQRRGSRQQRGYDREHTRLRARWKPKVDAGLVDCARCGTRIWLGQPWALDHTDDRAGYLGPSHKRCNDSAGGKAAHR